MSALADFAGRYGAFVWPAYAVAALVFAAMIIDTLLRTRHWRRAATGRSPAAGNRRRG